MRGDATTFTKSEYTPTRRPHKGRNHEGTFYWCLTAVGRTAKMLNFHHGESLKPVGDTLSRREFPAGEDLLNLMILNFPEFPQYFKDSCGEELTAERLWHRYHKGFHKHEGIPGSSSIGYSHEHYTNSRSCLHRIAKNVQKWCANRKGGEVMTLKLAMELGK